MKKLYLGVIIFFALIIFGLILYHIPIDREISMSVCSLSGEMKQMKIDVKYQRRLFSAPYVKGTVSLDGVEYIDEDSLYKTFSNITVAGESAKSSDFPENMVFCKATSKDILEAGNNRVIFVGLGEGNQFERLHFMFMDDSMMQNGHISGVSYYGPAATIEEAEEIAAALSE